MKRRIFLKRVGQTIAGLAIAPSAIKAKQIDPNPTSDPEKIYGFASDRIAIEQTQKHSRRYFHEGIRPGREHIFNGE